MKHVVENVIIDVNGIDFAVNAYDDYELNFHRVGERLDTFGSPIDMFDRVPSEHGIALKLFRELERVVVAYINKHRPPYIYFSANWDDSRYSLYSRFAKRLNRYGYRYSKDPDRPNIFYCYREK